MKEEIFIAGYGGQGIIAAGEIIAKAAMIEDLYAVLTKFYGAEVRGGPVGCGVIVSSEPIHFQFVRRPNFLLALHESGIKAHAPKIADIAIIDDDLVKHVDINAKQIIRLPIVRTADGIGVSITANIVILGSYAHFSRLIKIESIEKAIRSVVKKKYIDINLRALKEGYALAESINANA